MLCVVTHQLWMSTPSDSLYPVHLLHHLLSSVLFCSLLRFSIDCIVEAAFSVAMVAEEERQVFASLIPEGLYAATVLLVQNDATQVRNE